MVADPVLGPDGILLPSRPRRTSLLCLWDPQLTRNLCKLVGVEAVNDVGSCGTSRLSWRDAMSALLQNRTTTSQPF